MIVMKFGGTSVEDAKAIRTLSTLVERERGRHPVVVVSACAGVTNQLLAIAHAAGNGNKEEALKILSAVEARHTKIIAELLDKETAQSLGTRIIEDCEQIARLVSGVAVLGELTPRSLDTFAAFGERFSSLMIHQYFESQNIKSFWVDARQCMVTDDHFTKAAVDFDRTQNKLKEIIHPKISKGYVVITQGFIGATPDGITTTIGRGGSDYSAAIIGSLLQAEDIQIWTDVDGILTCDPSLVKDAKRIKIMSFNEAAELAYFGARVLHPETILPAVKKNIPVRVLNSKNPDSSGTVIVSKPKTDRHNIVKSIAYKEGVTMISIVSSRMFLATGFLENVFDVFHKYGTVVHTVATSEVSVTATIDDTRHLQEIVKELKRFSTVTVADRKAIICVVGDNLRNTVGIASRILRAIADAEVNINMISQGASEINISFVIDEEHITQAVRSLHAELFADADSFHDIFE